MDPEWMTALAKLADGVHPRHDWPLRATFYTDVSYVGIKGRKGEVRARVIHPPRAGEHIRWRTFGKDGLADRCSYYEVLQVQWDVRDRYRYLYRPGEEAEGYLTVFVKPVQSSPGEVFDRLERAEWRRRERRRMERRKLLAPRTIQPNP